MKEKDNTTKQICGKRLVLFCDNSPVNTFESLIYNFLSDIIVDSTNRISIYDTADGGNSDFILSFHITCNNACMHDICKLFNSNKSYMKHFKYYALCMEDEFSSLFKLQYSGINNNEIIMDCIVVYENNYITYIMKNKYENIVNKVVLKEGPISNYIILGVTKTYNRIEIKPEEQQFMDIAFGMISEYNLYIDRDKHELDIIIDKNVTNENYSLLLDIEKYIHMKNKGDIPPYKYDTVLIGIRNTTKIYSKYFYGLELKNIVITDQNTPCRLNFAYNSIDEGDTVEERVSRIISTKYTTNIDKNESKFDYTATSSTNEEDIPDKYNPCNYRLNSLFVVETESYSSFRVVFAITPLIDSIQIDLDNVLGYFLDSDFLHILNDKYSISAKYEGISITDKGEIDIRLYSETIIASELFDMLIAHFKDIGVQTGSTKSIGNVENVEIHKGAEQEWK